MSIVSSIGHAISGAASGLASGGPAGAIAGAVRGASRKGRRRRSAAEEVQGAAQDLATLAGHRVTPEEALAHASQLAGGLPAEVRNAVRSVAHELQASARNRTQLVSAIQSSPEIREMVGAVRLAQIQRQATNEHRGIVAADARHRESARKQAEILAKLDRIEAQLSTRTPIANRFVAALGGRALLDRLR